MVHVPISVKYDLDHGEHRLDIYDAGVALMGISRSLSIAVHYFVNGNVIKQAPSLDGANIYLRPPREGSFIFEIDVGILTSTVGGMAVSGVVGSACWEFLKHVYSKVIGIDCKPQNSTAQKLAYQDEGAIDAIVDTIEGDVASIHRPIIKNSRNVFIVSGQNNIVTLNRKSYDYVTAKIISDDVENFIGTVSSFNANSGKGRIFVKNDGRTIPFMPEDDEFNDRQKTLLAWSLNEYVNGREGLLKLDATHISTPGGLLKSLNVHDVTKA